MFRHTERTFSLPGLSLILVACLAAAPLSARTPAQRDTILDNGDQAVLKPPVVDFGRALQRIEPPIKPEFRRVVSPDAPDVQTAKADLADLIAALVRADVPEDKVKAVVKQYAATRTAVLQYAHAMDAWQSSSRRGTDDARKEPQPPAPQIDLTGGLPEEFAQYLRGAVDWHKGQADLAVVAWGELLKLPEAQRRYRSTWAAHMIGKALLDAKPAEAAAWFARVRALAKADFVDSLGLAADSYGWEALAELRQKHFPRATELYLAQLARGDSSAVQSLQTVVQATLRAGEDAMKDAAKNSAARRAISAYLVSYKQFIDDPWAGGTREKLTAAWLKAIKDAGAEPVVSAADLAWLSYQAGDTAAADWVGKDDQAAPVAQWVQAKLLLRKDRTDEAAAALGKVLDSLPKNDAWQDVRNRVSGELAAIRMARGQYADALDLLLRADFDDDAGYVAQRVLTADELAAYVDRHWPQPAAPGAAAGAGAHEDTPEARAREQALAVRWLLARRLVRFGRRKDARDYFPADLRAKLDAYDKALADGAEPSRPQADRAKCLRDAARVARADGVLLMAAGLDPHAGRWREDATADRRLGPPKDGQVLLVSDDEKQRVRRHAAELGRELLHRFVAAEHAWSAALLMPDESDQTARFLCEAGSWIKAQDAKAADKFYKAMVLRCGKTKLGQEAAKLRWFPSLSGE